MFAVLELVSRDDCFLSLEAVDACLLTSRASMMAFTNDFGDLNAPVEERRNEPGDRSCMNEKCAARRRSQAVQAGRNHSLSALSKHFIAMSARRTWRLNR